MSVIVYRVWLPIEFASLNEYISAERTSKFKAAAIKREETDAVTLIAKTSGVFLRFEEPPFLWRYRWLSKNRRKDPSNICAHAVKVIEDGLVKAGVVENDGWRQVAEIRHEFVVSGGDIGVVVTLETRP